MKNYFKVLGLGINATDAQIKSRYRELAKKFHPDRNHSASATLRMSAINEAFAVLREPKKRAAHVAQLQRTLLQDWADELRKQQARPRSKHANGATMTFAEFGERLGAIRGPGHAALWSFGGALVDVIIKR